MSATHSAALNDFMEGLIRRNPGEVEFHQAVYEVASNVFEYCADREIYRKHEIMRRIAEPDRIVIWPHLLPEMTEVRARIRHGAHSIQLTIHNQGSGIQRVLLDQQEWDRFEDEKVFIDLPEQDTDLEIWLE